MTGLVIPSLAIVHWTGSPTRPTRSSSKVPATAPSWLSNTASWMTSDDADQRHAHG